MSWADEYFAITQKKKKDEEDEKKAPSKAKSSGSSSSWSDEYFAELEKYDVKEEDDDIAPTITVSSKSKKKDKGLDFFQKGALEDGITVGNIGKAILGTVGDVGSGVIKGAGRLVEGVVDAGMYGVAAVADNNGNDSLADRLRKKAQFDFVGEDFKKTDEFLDKYSVLGRTSDAAMEGLGQVGAVILAGGLAGAAGLGTVGATALTTGAMGVSSFGSGVGEAYEGGADDDEAMTYGAIKGVVDAGSELIFGGLGKAVKALGLSRGLTSLDDMFAKKLSSKIANQTIKNLAEYGVKASAEGVEELIAGFGSAVGKNLTYMKDEDLRKLVEDERLLEQFVVGAVTSGIAQSGIVPGMKSGSLKESNEKGRDFIDGLSANERKVIDKEFENRLAEQDGELTKREKSKIYDEVIRAMEEGEISTDTIEEVLGGDTYKAYRDTIDSEDSVLKEYEELGNKSNATLAEQSRYAELKAELDDIKQNSQRDQLRAKLGEDVFNLVKGDRLVESYNERSRRGQAFDADLTQYDEKQRAVIQKAIDSGILNNTRRTHKFVDMIAKISADKGVLFDFTNNDKLKESGFAVDGKTVNGYVTKDGVTLNIQSAKALNSVVGHEITHVLEGTELYDALQNTVVEYAKSKGDYRGRYDSLMKLYEGVEGANVDAELTADLVGDYLFTDSDFINNLSVNHRNVFQKVYDEIKYLCKIATAGSKEARELEKVKRAFDKAYREGGKEKNAEEFYDSSTKYSLRVTDKETLDFLDNQETVTTYKTMQLVDGKLYPPMASRIEGRFEDYSELGAWEQATEHPELIKNGNKFKLDKGKGQGSIEAAYNPYMHSSNLVLNDQFSGAYKRDNLVTVECEVPASELTSGYHAEYAKDSVGWHPWHTGTVAGQLRNAKGTERQVLLSRWIKPVRIVPDSEVAAKYKELLDGTNVEVPDNVVTPALLSELKKAGVKIKESGRVREAKYSISDSDYLDAVNRGDTDAVQKMVDEAAAEYGYNHRGVHRAKSEFTVFDRSKIGSGAGLQFGDGFYVSLEIRDKATADYADSAYGKVKMDLYVKMRSPLELGKPVSKETVARMRRNLAWFGDDASVKYGVSPETVREQLVSGDSYEQMEAIHWLARKNDIQVSELLKEYGFDGIISDSQYVKQAVVFDENQLKSADPVTYDDNGNVIPLSERFNAKNDDIRYSLSDSDGKQLSKEQQEYFKDSKMRDENGNLKVMYHGSRDAGFHVFDASMSDDDTSFFFVDRNDVAASYSSTTETYEAKTIRTAEDMNNFLAEIGQDEDYSVVEKDGEFILLYDGERVAASDTAPGIYKEFCWYEGVGEGDANYKVYLNLKNPLVVDAEGRNWDNVSTEFYPELYEQFKTSFTAEEKAALVDLAEWEDFGVFKHEIERAVRDAGKPTADENTKLLNSAYWKNADMNSLFSMAADNFSDEVLRAEAVKQMNTRDYAQRAKEQGYDGVIFNNIVDIGQYGADYTPATVAIAFESNQIKSVANAKPTADPDIRYSLSDSDGNPIDSARVSDNELDTKYSLSHNEEIAHGQSDYMVNHRVHISDDELAEAQKVTAAMVDVMMKYSSILPEDKIGKVLTKNGSYDHSVENTTICVRTLAYNEFVDKVQEEIGRPLTQMESFLVSQKLYDIAVEPQCLYCYVSLDRKAFNDMLLRYMTDRDSVIAKYNNSDKSPAAVEALYEEFLHGRKDTKPMKDRFNKWLGYVDNGTQLLSLADIATEDRQSVIKANGGILAAQLADARAYAQSASWSKIQKNYVAYRDEILKLNDRVVKNLNEHYGLRWYSFSDYSAAFIVENMQQITDASIRGLKGLAYTKDTDFAEIFAQSGMNINVSVFVNQDADGNFFIDEKQSADFEKAKALRERYPNVGIVATVTNDDALRWVGEQEWSDVIIPFHIVRTGTDVAEYYKWLNYTAESADTISDKDMWNAYLDSLNLKSEGARRKVSKNIYPSEHKNDKATYLNLCESRGLSPRFVRFAGEDWYMKLVNETRLSADESPALKPSYNLEAAQASFQKFVDKGGYEGGWYKGGVDVDAEARAVADDVLAGRKANEVSYGRQDGFVPEALIAGRKTNRKHGQLSLSAEGEQPLFKGGDFRVYGKDIALETAPVQETPTVAENATVDIAPVDDDERIASLSDADAPPVRQSAPTEPEEKLTRSGLHQSIVDNIKSRFKAKGFDFDKVLKNAKDLSTFATVDNTPQRVMEKALGYKEGQLLSDITVNQVAQNETEGIKWLNSFTDRKSGVLAQLSKKYGIKPGSKESAAAQMYAEGFYVAENNDIIEYGDAELAKDFPDASVRANIKGLAGDPIIRQIYDDTLAMINESRTRNAYPEIQRLDNYFLHFRAMDDTFSRLGLPFNPNDIRAKDLPTDLNGVTADLKPGQPYFASAMHRTGKRTSFDLLGGLERYLSSAKNQIYHIDDIQTLRALRNYIADTYGQANGLEHLDTLSEEEQQERINQVFGSHLSTFAKFLNEEANILAGKTALIDRGLEGIIGRRGITFLDTVNKQVGSNMVGYNISSSLTNFLPVAQTFAKTNKFDFVKAFAQTVAHKVSRRSDGFAENSPVMIRRNGADRFYRTAWQKMSDPGYALMGAVDSISTELIARTKYNELVRKGMDAQKAHYETDKWVSRLMGDRSLGQQPQIYNSKMLGLVTKFQLEVRNQLDSQFYDTIQEAKVSNEHIENELARNAKTAAKVASTFVQLAVVQHLFGKAFESVAGYNPAFDIIGVMMTALGFDDDEESEDTALDNIEQGFLALLEDLPYTSTLTGGRIPISSALPISELVKGQDEWGNEKSRWETLGEVAPYYVLPGGYGQIKKTKQGLSMFSEDHPIAGSYTDSGNLRFPVDDTLGNRVQAGIFGQWASDNARDYFDNGRSPLKEKQIEEFIDLDMPIRDYWDYREGLKEQETLEDKFDYIAGLDLSVEQKNIMINNVVDRKEAVDMANYDDFSTYEEFDFYTKNKEKYEFLEANGVSYSEYKSSDDAKEKYDATYSWYKNYPEKVTVAKAIMDNMVEYRKHTSALNAIRGDDNDGDGRSDSGTAKKKKTDYIFGLDIDYGQKVILYRSLFYSKKDRATYDGYIVDYLNERDDLTYDDRVTILKELDFTVTDDGTVYW